MLHFLLNIDQLSFLPSLIVILRRMTPYPITWTHSSSRKSPPVVSWLKRPHPPHHYPAQTALPLRPPTLTAIAASCLRWDQSGISINYGARVLFSICFLLSCGVNWCCFLVCQIPPIIQWCQCQAFAARVFPKSIVLHIGHCLFPLPNTGIFSFPHTGLLYGTLAIIDIR